MTKPTIHAITQKLMYLDIPSVPIDSVSESPTSTDPRANLAILQGKGKERGSKHKCLVSSYANNKKLINLCG